LSWDHPDNITAQGPDYYWSVGSYSWVQGDNAIPLNNLKWEIYFDISYHILWTMPIGIDPWIVQVGNLDAAQGLLRSDGTWESYYLVGNEHHVHTITGNYWWSFSMVEGNVPVSGPYWVYTGGRSMRGWAIWDASVNRPQWYIVTNRGHEAYDGANYTARNQRVYVVPGKAHKVKFDFPAVEIEPLRANYLNYPQEFVYPWVLLGGSEPGKIMGTFGLKTDYMGFVSKDNVTGYVMSDHFIESGTVSKELSEAKKYFRMENPPTVSAVSSPGFLITQYANHPLYPSKTLIGYEYTSEASTPYANLCFFACMDGNLLRRD
jgi:hypothetical protein